MVNKLKIINDPVYGFIQIPSDLIYDLVEHPLFQRLRRIRQLGLSYLVYPGAQHTRFHHALGAMHLMHKALEVIKGKDVLITQEEFEGALAAILLHDLGHGPFSHVLEQSILPGIHHEEVSLMMMKQLNEEMGGKLETAIAIFTGSYPKKFLHELVSSQLDMDRLDYLTRDSFYTGVSEGIIGTERIIQMLNVAEDTLVVDEKGIYSVEKFIIARRLMYWQVYLHKATLAADEVLLGILKRAKELTVQGESLFASPSLSYFLKTNEKQALSKVTMQHYQNIDDNDILCAVKVWMEHPDRVLRYLCQSLINRKLPAIQLSREPVSVEELESKLHKCKLYFNLNDHEASYLVNRNSVKNEAYKITGNERIMIRTKQGKLSDIADFSDNYNISALKEVVTRHYLSYPKEIQ